MGETKWHYSPKCLKKRFKDMTHCLQCGHLDAFESAKRVGPSYLDIVKCCPACHSTDIKRRKTIVLAQTWIPASEWNKEIEEHGEPPQP